jgi:spore germination protein GerM
MMRRWSVVLLVIAASCGVPVERTAKTIELRDIVLEIAPPTTSAVSPVEPDSVRTRAVVIYLIRGEGLIGRARSTLPEFTIEDLIDLLAAGPSAGDILDDLSTGIDPSDPTVESVEIRDGLAYLGLSDAFLEDSSVSQTLVLGQIVITLMSNLPLDGVQFTSNGLPIAVPNAEGTPVTEPVRRRDYASLLNG